MDVYISKICLRVLAENISEEDLAWFEDILTSDENINYLQMRETRIARAGTYIHIWKMNEENRIWVTDFKTFQSYVTAVSYTHLTLPTICSV